jgi:cell shape-determining protein MreC
MRGDGKDDRLYAGVLITPNVSPYDSLVVDKGSRDGVVPGAVVYRNNATPIGIIAKTDSSTSVVSLFSTPGAQVDVYVRGPNVHAKATGVGAGALEVLLPHGVKVHEGDAVLLPTVRGERIGTVAHITDDPAEPGAVASIVDAFAPASLRFVAIAKEAFTVPSRTIIEGYLRESASSTVLLLTTPGTTTPTSTSHHQ